MTRRSIKMLKPLHIGQNTTLVSAICEPWSCGSEKFPGSHHDGMRRTVHCWLQRRKIGI
ncbi:hypothetical protein T11_2077, partial [Trichinella zimbabwensis]